MEYSPAMSVSSDFSDMDDDALELYLASCVPLSNLPTPPPAMEHHIPAAPSTPPLSTSELQHHHAPRLEVHATHLANLVPRNVSARTPEVTIISATLDRAGLPVEVVAFAGCILDALSSRFGGAWREALGPSKKSPCDLHFGYHVWQRSTASPTLIVLSALALAYGYLDDHGRCNSHWTKMEASGRFEAREVELTKTCMLQDMDYGLFRIGEEMVERRVRDLQRACDSACPRTALVRKDSAGNAKGEGRPRLSLSTGTSGVAIWAHGVQTPEPSP